MSARFQVFCTAASVGGALRWRLLSENGRPLALSPLGFASLDQAVADAGLARRHAATATAQLSSPGRAGWGWVLVAGAGVELDQPEAGATAIAHSARRFARRVECNESVLRFRRLAADATLPDRLLVFARGGR